MGGQFMQMGFHTQYPRSGGGKWSSGTRYIKEGTDFGEGTQGQTKRLGVVMRYRIDKEFRKEIDKGANPESLIGG